MNAWPSGIAGKLSITGMALVLIGSAGCKKNHKQTQLPPAETAPAETPVYPHEKPADHSQVKPALPARIPVTPLPAGGVSAEDLDFVASHKPILSESGYATWYSAPYKGRRAANGQVFDDNSMTAAHRTLPMGTLVTVTNLRTGQSAAMRIGDRGPFIPGRIVDLTIASAKATGVYLGGLVPVRVDVYSAPKPIESGGRWCVQIGAFTSQARALRLKQELQRDYPTANVIEFPGERSYWVRIRPESDDRAQAESIAQRLHPEEGNAFLTRLD